MEDYEEAPTPSDFAGSPVKPKNEHHLDTPSTVPSSPATTSQIGRPNEFGSSSSFFLANHVTSDIFITPNSPENVQYSDEEVEEDYSEDEVDHGGNKEKVYAELQCLPAIVVPLQRVNDVSVSENRVENLESGPTFTGNLKNDSATANSTATVENDHERGENLKVFPNRGDAERGWCSPMSSQGSMSSGEYTWKLADGLTKNTTKVQNILENPELFNISPTSIQYDLIQSYFSDKQGVDRFISHFINDVIASACYTGFCRPNTEHADDLKAQLQSLDQNKILGVIGRVLLEKSTTPQVALSQQIAINGCTNSCVSSSDKSVQAHCSTDRTVAFQRNDADNITVSPETVREFSSISKENFEENGQTASTIFSSPNGASGRDTCLPVPNLLPYANTPEAVVSPSFAKGTKRRGIVNQACQPTTRFEKNCTWEDANDAIQENAPYVNKQIEKCCQILFDAIMTQNEIKTCTWSGKTTKNKMKSTPFNKEKIRLIKEGCAFLLNKPNALTMKAFMKAKKTKTYPPLNSEQMKLMEKKVLQEYAYRQRRNL